MKITHVAAEHADFAHTGGLGEVLVGLPEAQARLGDDVTVVLPGYRMALERAPNAHHAYDVHVQLPWGTAVVHAYVLVHRGVRVVFLHEPALFDRATLYGEPFSDNPVRFAVFARAAARIAGDSHIAHLHDWHAGLAAPHLTLLHPSPRHRPAVVFTVHNLAFQGAFSREAAALTGLPASTLSPEGVLHHGRISPLKAGLYYADQITTVSPTYARELQTETFGWDFAGLFRHRASELVGIVNGLDEAPSPSTPRAELRAAFCAEAGVQNPRGPLAIMVSRLTAQKGVDLVIAAVPTALALGMSVVVIGSGASELTVQLTDLARAHPGRVAFLERFDTELAARAYAASDVVMVPSRFEPCGLVQLHAMHHGALPIVRKTGGLADTVRDVAEGGWGFVMNGDDLDEALARAATLFEDAASFEGARTRAQAQPIGWSEPARRYRALYERLGSRSR